MQLQSIDLATMEVKAIETVDQARFDFASAEIHDEIYVIGGHYNSQNLATVEK